MNFCEICGNIVIAEKRGVKTGWFCRKCNKFFEDKEADSTALSQKIKHPEDKVNVFNPEDAFTQYPKTKVICDKCGNNEAYWYMQQTRGADEPQTKFFCCTKCKHKWREY